MKFEKVVHGLRYAPVPFLTDLIRSFGDIVKLPFGDRDLYVLASPDFIQEVFLGDPKSFAKRKDSEAEREYLEAISRFVPLFNEQLIPEYAPLIVEAANRAHKRWLKNYAAQGPFEVDMYREMGSVTLEVAVRILFGVDAQNEAATLFQAILTMDHGYGFDPIEATLGVLMPEPEITITPQSKQARACIQDYVEHLVRKENKQGSTSFLADLVRFMGPDQAVPSAMASLFGMHEVTATTVPWTWYHLAQNPELDKALVSEVASVLNGRDPQLEDVPVLSYTRMLLAESRRLYPVVWAVGRFIRQDISFGEYGVPAGSIALASQYVTHRDARFYRDPERFDPMRWTTEARTARPEFSFFPFSAGPRACAGQAFAELLDASILASLAQHWKAQPVDGQKPLPVPQKSSAPRPGIRTALSLR